MLRELLPKIIELYYKQEYSIAEVAKTLGISKSHTQRIFKEAGYELRNASQAMLLAFKKDRAIRNHTPKTLEHKRKLSVAQIQYLSKHDHQFLDRHHSVATKAKLRERRISSGTRAKISASRKGKPSSMQGRHHTEETKRKMSEARKRAYAEVKLISPFNPLHPKFNEAVEKDRLSKIGDQNPMRGPHREVAIAKIRQARLNQIIPYEWTSIEKAIASLLDDSTIPYIHGFNLGNKFQCDFGLPIYNLIIECDGDYWHSFPDKRVRDDNKNQYALSHGWKILRLKENSILNDMVSCKKATLNMIKESKVKLVTL